MPAAIILGPTATVRGLTGATAEMLEVTAVVPVVTMRTVVIARSHATIARHAVTVLNAVIANAATVGEIVRRAVRTIDGAGAPVVRTAAKTINAAVRGSRLVSVVGMGEAIVAGIAAAATDRNSGSVATIDDQMTDSAIAVVTGARTTAGASVATTGDQMTGSAIAASVMVEAATARAMVLAEGAVLTSAPKSAGVLGAGGQLRVAQVPVPGIVHLNGTSEVVVRAVSTLKSLRGSPARNLTARCGINFAR